MAWRGNEMAATWHGSGGNTREPMVHRREGVAGSVMCMVSSPRRDAVANNDGEGGSVVQLKTAEVLRRRSVEHAMAKPVV